MERERKVNKEVQIKETKTDIMRRLTLVLAYSLAFFLPYIILVFVFRQLDFYPHGGKSLLFMDMDGIIAPILESAWQMAKGEGSIFFSWSKAMGTNFIGVFALTLSDPFTFLILLFNPDDIQLAVYYLTLIKISMCGLTSFIFLRYMFKGKDALGKGAIDKDAIGKDALGKGALGKVSARKGSLFANFYLLLFSTSYALISYNIMYSSMLQWIDAVMLLPIILLGAEKILKKEKPYVFVVSLSMMFVASYYISYMVCVFGVLFVLYRYFCGGVADGAGKEKGAEGLDETHAFRDALLDFTKMIGRFLGWSALAVGSALWILLPTYMDLTSGKMAFANYKPDTLVNFPFKNLMGAFVRGEYTSMTNAGLPALYAGVLVGVGFALYFVLKNFSYKGKALTFAFFAFLVASLYYTKLDMAWHTFRYPNWFPYRWSFVFHFFVNFIACQAFMEAGWSLYSYAKGKWKGRVRVINGVAAVLLPLLLVAVGIDLAGNTKGFFQGIDGEFGYKDVSEYASFREQNAPLFESVKESDDSLYRMEKNYRRSYNDAFTLNYKGASHYSTAFNSNHLNYTKQMGFSQDWFWSSYVGSTVLTDALFNFKYIASKGRMPKDYPQVAASGDAVMYQNPYVLPIGFMADENAADDVSLEGNNHFEKQNRLLNHLMGQGQNPVAYFEEVEGVRRNEAVMEYRFVASQDYPVYLSFPASNNSGGSAYVNGERLAPYFTPEGNHVLFVGEFDVGTEVVVSFDANRDSLGLMGEYIYYLNTDELENAVRTLEQGGLTNLTYRNSHIKAQVEAAEDGVMFTSIPYDEGFTVRVDGKKTKHFSLNDMFMVFPVSEGRHDVEITFLPKGFGLGLAVSLVSLALLVLYAVFPLVRQVKSGGKVEDGESKKERNEK